MVILFISVLWHQYLTDCFDTGTSETRHLCKLILEMAPHKDDLENKNQIKALIIFVSEKMVYKYLLLQVNTWKRTHHLAVFHTLSHSWEWFSHLMLVHSFTAPVWQVWTPSQNIQPWALLQVQTKFKCKMRLFIFSFFHLTLTLSSVVLPLPNQKCERLCAPCFGSTDLVW